jgi:hypothetical protein
MTQAPIAFISYSHDSSDHKQWVAEFASKLRHNGVDAILDQWAVGPGDDIARFMEDGVTRADRVIVICTDGYIRKADAGEGGVGFEKMIVTAELVQDLGTNKFIPVIRNVSCKRKTPKFLGTRFYVDQSGTGDSDEQFEILLRELHKTPATQKPPLGKNPFARLPSGAEARPPNGQPVTPVAIPSELISPEGAYSTAVEIARQNDLLGWRQLVKQIRPPVYALLSDWRCTYEKTPPKDVDGLKVAVDDAVQRTASLMVIGLAGVESGRDAFVDQRSLLDDLLSISGWNPSGYKTLVSLPSTLAYVYQALHGTMALITGQPQVALRMANTELVHEHTDKMEPLWQRYEVVGWPETLGGTCSKAWDYLYKAPERWGWLADVFGSADDYRMGLVSYYMVLSLNELATYIRSGDALSTDKGRVAVNVNVPVCFLTADSQVSTRSVAQVRRHMATLLKELSVTEQAVQSYWDAWIGVCKKWLRGVYRSPFSLRMGVPYAGLFPPLKA